jgi:hypothetical protein
MRLALALLLATACWAQAPATLGVPGSDLPPVALGAGFDWTRGSPTAHAADVVVAIHIPKTSWYSWTTISTPAIRQPSGAPATPSTITTGGAWLPVQTAGGMMRLVFILQAGFSSIAANSTIAPTFSGSLGLAFRLGKKSNVYLFPYAKSASASTVSSTTAVVSAIFQPGVMLLYGFGAQK